MAGKFTATNTQDSKFVDVTSKFFDAVLGMDQGKVEASPYFDMIEGARALELGNKRLDTGLIEMALEEVAFSACLPLPLSSVTAIINELTKLVVSWTEGASLLVTVLSLRHVLQLLQNYQQCGSLEESGFVNARLQDLDADPSTESLLVNKVLRAFVVGLAKFVGAVIKVALDSLYEEEDLITRTMDLDFLSRVSPQIVTAEIDEAELWLRSQTSLRETRDFSILSDQLRLVRRLVQLESVTAMSLNLFNEKEPLGLPHVANTLEILDKLKSAEYAEFPPTAFSKFVQLDCNNKHIPSEIVTVSQTIAYDCLRKLFCDINEQIRRFSRLANASQLDLYLKFHASTSFAREASAVARGMFLLFLIHDDKTIAGLNDTVASMGMRLMSGLSLCGNSILEPSQWLVESDTVRADCLSKMSRLLDDLEAAFFQKFSVAGNNRCRQRQLNNRSIVILDSLQFNAENIEVELFGHGIGDKLSAAYQNAPALGISSFVYFHKLDVMIDVVLSGFEQNLYSVETASMMYWYASELSSISYEHVVGRMKEINTAKLASIAALAKRVKKTKAGEKKEQLKATLRYMHDVVEADLNSNIAFIEAFLGPLMMAMFHLCKGISIALQIMRSVAAGDSTENFMADKKLLYALRMKPWSSVGTPEVPLFERYEDENSIEKTLKLAEASVRKHQIGVYVKACTSHLRSCGQAIGGIIEVLQKNDVLKARILSEEDNDTKAWLLKIKKTCDIYSAQMLKLASSTGDFVGIERRPGFDPYFPVYCLK